MLQPAPLPPPSPPAGTELSLRLGVQGGGMLRLPGSHRGRHLGGEVLPATSAASSGWPAATRQEESSRHILSTCS